MFNNFKKVRHWFEDKYELRAYIRMDLGFGTEFGPITGKGLTE